MERNEIICFIERIWNYKKKVRVIYVYLNMKYSGFENIHAMALHDSCMMLFRIYDGEVYYSVFVTFNHSTLPISERFRYRVDTWKHDAREQYFF